MATFSVNQTRQLYVAKQLLNTAAHIKDESSPIVGGIMVKKYNDGKSVAFEYKGAGGITRSDAIDLDKIMSVTCKRAADLEIPRKAILVKTPSTLVAGQDYILNVDIRQFVSKSDQSYYLKNPAVRAFASDTQSTLAAKMAMQLAKDFSREPSRFFKFYVTTNATVTTSTITEVTEKTKLSDLSSSYVGIVIVEEPQDWNRGLYEFGTVDFKVYASTIKDASNNEVIWAVDETDILDLGVVSGLNANYKNGKKIADMEWFYMGERGDQYRGMGYPDYIPTTYLVDETKGYDTLDIHYYSNLSNESVQKSEKDITIVADGASSPNLMDSILAELAGANVPISLTISAEEDEVDEGETLQFTSNVSTVTWGTSDASVATISSAGLLTAGSVAADTEVTVTATLGNQSVSKTITVKNV